LGLVGAARLPAPPFVRGLLGDADSRDDLGPRESVIPQPVDGVWMAVSCSLTRT
jgi:hypothetical protein